jgi:TPR repeat protein
MRPETIRACRSECDRGNQDACADLGEAYEFGSRGVAKDKATAYALLEPACRAGHARACTRAGEVVSDPGQAARLASRGCESGDAMGCGDLATAYADGKGVPRDERAAVDLYERACGGMPFFCVFAGEMFEDGKGTPVDYARAAQLYSQACASHEPLDESGCLHLGRMYLAGLGFEPDRARAIELFREACARNGVIGCDDLRELGEPVPERKR